MDGGSGEWMDEGERGGKRGDKGKSRRMKGGGRGTEEKGFPPGLWGALVKCI